MLYRQKGEIMQHTGLYLGDGTVIDARGTKYGVVHQAREKYAWTHYAIPKSWGGAEEEKGEDEKVQTMVVTADSGSTVNLRTRPDKAAPVLAKVPIGEAVQVLSLFGGWATVQRDGVTGYMMAQYLRAQGEASPTLEERVKQLEERVAALEGGRG
nr:MAG TPA: SH3 domain protein [Caudoviricetes sp.]